MKITAIARNNKTSASGKPYVSLGLKVAEHGDKWINGFGNKDNADWKVGDEVDITILEKGQYLNFEMPKSFQKGGTNGDLNRIETKLDNYYAAIMTELKMIRGQLPKPSEDEFNPPF